MKTTARGEALIDRGEGRLSYPLLITDDRREEEQARNRSSASTMSAGRRRGGRYRMVTGRGEESLDGWRESK
jgi:hypothetical protein